MKMSEVRQQNNRLMFLGALYVNLTIAIRAHGIIEMSVH